MGKLLFSFGGRINPADFQQGAIVLIVIGFVLKVLPFFSMTLGMLLGIVGMILIWPWIAIWAKRYHDAGKSGWMLLVPVLVLIVLSVVVGMILNMVIPIDKSAVEAAASSGDFMAIIQGSAAAAKPQIIPGAVLSAIVQFAVVYLFNGMIKSDPEENRFGPATN